MDFFNNEVGRNAYVFFPPESAYWSYYSDIAYGLVISGQLKYIVNGQLKATNQ